MEKYKKLYEHLVKAKEIQSDIVCNDGLKMTKFERQEIVKVWNLLDDVALTVHNLI